MSEERLPEGTDYLSAEDIARWAKQEVEEAAKAFQLRTHEVSELARAYSAGEITPQEADTLHSRYFHRWGESLPGVTLGPNVTDEQIIAGVDQAAMRMRGSYSPSEDNPRPYLDRFGVKDGPTPRSRG